MCDTGGVPRAVVLIFQKTPYAPYSARREVCVDYFVAPSADIAPRVPRYLLEPLDATILRAATSDGTNALTSTRSTCGSYISCGAAAYGGLYIQNGSWSTRFMAATPAVVPGASACRRRSRTREDSAMRTGVVETG